MGQCIRTKGPGIAGAGSTEVTGACGCGRREHSRDSFLVSQIIGWCTSCFRMRYAVHGFADVGVQAFRGKAG